MASTITPNMGLIVPGIGTEPSPTWGQDQTASMGILDQHNHSAGQGVQITPDGININTAFSMNENNITRVNTVNFTALAANLPGSAPNLGCIYVSGNELVYNDEAGNVVPITNNGSVNAGSGSITGLPSGTASASYSSGNQTFVWQSSTSTPANMDFGSAVIRNITANSKGLTLSPPTALAADYGIIFPLLPGSTQFVTLDTSGNMGTQTNDQIAQGMSSVGANAISNVRTITIANPAAVGGLALSGESFNYTTTATSYTLITNFTITITTSGRPVEVSFVPIEDLTSDIHITGSAGIQPIAMFQILQNGGTHSWNLNLGAQGVSGNGNCYYTPSSVYFLDTTVNGVPGTYTYTAFVQVNSSTTSVFINHNKLMAKEI